MRYILLALLAALNSVSEAQVYGPQVEEFNFSVKSYFYSHETRSSTAWKEEADLQLSHSFGIFQSAQTVRKYGLSSNRFSGIGAVQFPIDYQITGREKQEDGTMKVYYSATGKILLQKDVAAQVIDEGGLQLPLPVQLEGFYDVACTDPHYPSEGDFWYFFNPFQSGCESLSKPPRADSFVIKLRPSSKRELDMNVRLDLLRGNNDNGSVFRIDVIHGFESSSTSRLDEGRRAYRAFHKYLKDDGYKVEQKQKYFNRPLIQFTKLVELADGREIVVEINSLLVETGIESKTVTFAKFIRKSVEDADVIFYGGHSGLGGNLDIESLEYKAGGFKFNANKRQIFIFDSCSSYSYYLAPFREQKTRARIDVVTMGLASLFDTGLPTLKTFIEEFTNPDVEDRTWEEVLTEVDDRLGNINYLINVGGI